MKKGKFISPILTCDYCGSSIDTGKYSRCPNCGASYELDEEWINRYENESNYIYEDKSFNKYSNINSYYGYKEEKKKHWGIIAFFSIIAFFAVIGIFAAILENIHRFDHDHTKLNEYSFEDYQLVDYNIEGDGVILNDNGVKVTVKNVYKDMKSSKNDFKLEFEIVNDSDKNVSLSIKANQVNNYQSSTNYMFIYDDFKKHTTSTIYKEVNDIKQGEIKEILFDEIYLRDSGFNKIYENSEPYSLTTNSDVDISYDFANMNKIYTDDYFDIYSCYSKVSEYKGNYNWDSNGFEFIVYNKSDYNFEYSTSDIVLDGKSLDSYIGDGKIYANSVLETYTNSYDDEFKDIKNKDFKISFIFDCIDNAELSYKTQYLNMKDLYWK